MDHNLRDKIAVVTGGSAGIGLGIAKHLVAEGARVFITGRHQPELDKAVAEIGGGAAALTGDASSLAGIGRIYGTVKAGGGRIDVLVANAGVYEFSTFGQVTEAHFDTAFNINVRGLFFTVQKALPLLADGSSVILLGSIASLKGMPSLSVYDATKAAVRSFARGWILDLKGRGIRVNVLSPGFIDTPGLSHFLTDQQKAELSATVPLARLGTPDDIAKVAVFLASDASGYVNGIELFVDGGAAQY